MVSLNSKKEKKRGAKSLILGVSAILGIVFLVLIALGNSDSLAIDEMVHIPAGFTHTYQGDYRYNAEHPPLANDLSGLFSAISKPKVPEDRPIDQWKFGKDFIYNAQKNATDVIFWGRYPIILLTLILLFLIFIWSRALWGNNGAIISLLLAGSCPNLIAHGHLATTDLILALSYTLNFYVLWKFCRNATWINTVFLGLAMGFAVLSKFSGLLVLPINIIFLYVFIITQRKDYLENIKKVVVSLGVALFAVWAVYFFSMRSDIRWLYFNHYGLNHFELSKAYFIDWLKILFWPFKKFKEGYDIVSSHNAGGHFSYLNGVFAQSGRPEYFFYAYYYKTPIPAMILFFISILVFFKTKWVERKERPLKNYRNNKSVVSLRLWISTFSPLSLRGVPPWRDDAAIFHDRLLRLTPRNDIKKHYSTASIDAFYFVLLPAIIFFLFSVQGNLNIGLRHILPVYPLIYIFIGVLGAMKSKFWRYLAYLLVIANILIAIWSYPGYIAYFNHAAGGTLGGVKHLSDSNLDWGQNVKRFSQYLKENDIKNVYFECYDSDTIAYYGVGYRPIPKVEPVKGVIAMCASQYLLSQNTADYLWFIKEKPTKIVNGTIYLWDKTVEKLSQ